METIDVGDVVKEITSVLSKHLTRVIEDISSDKEDVSQNIDDTLYG